MVILSSPRVLESTRAITIPNYPENVKLFKQFIPQLKYNNNKIQINQIPKEETRNQITVLFSDDAEEKLEISKNLKFHEIFQNILEIDRKKTLEILSNRQKK